MNGIHYITDEKGKRIGVQIDLRKHKVLWEDFQDLLLAQSRKNEPRIAWETVKKQLRKKRAH